MPARIPDQHVGIDQDHRSESEARCSQLAHVSFDVGHLLAIAPHSEERIVGLFYGSRRRIVAGGFLLDAHGNARLFVGGKLLAPSLGQLAYLDALNSITIAFILSGPAQIGS